MALRGPALRLRLLLMFGLASVGAVAGTFTLTSTSFGSSTGLVDQSTGLIWLQLTITANHSYNEVAANLAPGGVYAGWHYATPADLATLFFDYSGGVVNDTLALQFMNDLGGPLQDISDSGTGFHRLMSFALLDIPFGLGHAIYGYIAVDNQSGPSINPGLQGSMLDSFAYPGTGSWLVQPVPEPMTGALLLSGVLVIALTKRLFRRRLQPSTMNSRRAPTCAVH